jgi:hypothetical protein
VLAARENRAIGGEIGLADAALERKAALEIPPREVVVEQAADAARLAAVRQEEVGVAARFELGIELGAEGLTGGARCAVPLDRVLLEAVVGSQIESAAELPARARRSLFSGREEAKVRV